MRVTPLTPALIGPSRNSTSGCLHPEAEIQPPRLSARQGACSLPGQSLQAAQVGHLGHLQRLRIQGGVQLTAPAVRARSGWRAGPGLVASPPAGCGPAALSSRGPAPAPCRCWVIPGPASARSTSICRPRSAPARRSARRAAAPGSASVPIHRGHPRRPALERGRNGCSGPAPRVRHPRLRHLRPGWQLGWQL